MSVGSLLVGAVTRSLPGHTSSFKHFQTVYMAFHNTIIPSAAYRCAYSSQIGETAIVRDILWGQMAMIVANRRSPGVVTTAPRHCSAIKSYHPRKGFIITPGEPVSGLIQPRGKPSQATAGCFRVGTVVRCCFTTVHRMTAPTRSIILRTIKNGL